MSPLPHPTETKVTLWSPSPSGPFAGTVVREHLGCDALGFGQTTRSCSSPTLLLLSCRSAGRPPAAPLQSLSVLLLQHSLWKCCFPEPPPLTRGVQGEKGLGGAKAGLNPQPSAGFGKPRPGMLGAGGLSHPIKALICATLTPTY